MYPYKRNKDPAWLAALQVNPDEQYGCYLTNEKNSAGYRPNYISRSRIHDEPAIRPDKFDFTELLLHWR